MKSVEKKDKKKVDALIDECLEELGATREEVEIEVINQGSLFAQAHVRVTLKETPETKAVAFVDELLAKMGLNCSATAKKDSDHVYINISGADNGMAIGYRGEVLDAMQYITLLAVNHGSDDFSKITLDAENYREKRTITLTDLAQKLAMKVIRTGRAVDLEPMNPFERRIVHTALQDNPEVVTESTGVEPNRYISIRPANAPQGSSNRQYGTSYDFRRKGASNPRTTRSFGKKKF